ncbi:MAG TPA: dephospho-CoA kinase [Anaerolineae bacterium]|nr:dephospho-CoA kinase [Anaerolineae bacterium]
MVHDQTQAANRGTIVIGLTGAIAAGKSTVAAMLANLGACIIDADDLSRLVMQPGAPTFDQVLQEFGPEIVTGDGKIDRAKLGARVFADAAALSRLEAIVHPAVLAEAETQLRAGVAHGCQVVVLEAIKLLESGLHRRCSEVWVVTAPRKQQVQRLMETRSLPRAEAELRIDAQPAPESRFPLATVIIDNSGSPEQTREAVEREWRRISVSLPPSPTDGGQMNLRKWIDTHPGFTMWVALAVGMVLIFWFTSGDAGMRLSQRLFVALVCVLLAGLCTWIVNWE